MAHFPTSHGLETSAQTSTSVGERYTVYVLVYVVLVKNDFLKKFVFVLPCILPLRKCSLRQ